MKIQVFDADDAVGGLGFGEAEINVGAEGVTGNAALVIGLGAGDFRAAETACDLDAHALGPKAHGRLHRALHGAAEGDAAFELLGDVLGHKLRVGLGLRTSTIFRWTSPSVMAERSWRSFSMSAPFFPMITPGRAA